MIYEYKCTNCSHKFEQNIPVADRDKDWRCPKCQSSSKRLFSTSFGVNAKMWLYPMREERARAKKELDRKEGIA